MTSCPLPPDLPRRADRRTGAKLVTQHFFPVSHRTLEAWPLTWRRVNGKAVCETAELFELAEAKLIAAPAVRGGRASRKREPPDMAPVLLSTAGTHRKPALPCE